MTSPKCPVCRRRVSVLHEPLADLRITLRELGYSKATHAHSSCVIRALKAALDRRLKRGNRPPSGPSTWSPDQ